MDAVSAELESILRRGSPKALEGLIETYQHRLFRYLLSLTGNRSSAEDLFQETWLRVLERGHQYRSRWRFDVWLFSIARNLAIDGMRRKKGSSLDELMDPDSGSGFEPAGSGPSPFEDVVAGEREAHVARVLDQIPAAYREVLTLRFQDEMALEEIAAVVKAPLSTVKSRLYRALESLRERMEVEQS
jgi:RNA polymerase sigma-70 factor (ECF subfamily)